MRFRYRLRLAGQVLSVAVVSACDSGGGAFLWPPSPTSPPLLSGVTLSGAIFEATPAGKRLVPAIRVFYKIENGHGGIVELAGNGHYTIPNLPEGAIVSVTTDFDAGVYGLQQRCPARTTLDGKKALDIEVIQPGGLEQSFESPTVSGVVFEMTPEGRRPIVGMGVEYYADFRFHHDAYTQTDAFGRYTFCRVPEGIGRIGTGFCPNESLVFVSAEVNGDTTVDIDLTDTGCS